MQMPSMLRSCTFLSDCWMDMFALAGDAHGPWTGAGQTAEDGPKRGLESVLFGEEACDEGRPTGTCPC